MNNRKPLSLLLTMIFITSLLSVSPASSTPSQVTSVNSIPFTEHPIEDGFTKAYAVFAVDLDGDDDVDLLAGGDPDDCDLAWFENDGEQGFTKHCIKADYDSVYSIFAADMDGDNDPDVFSVATFDDKVTWWENDGLGNLTEHTIDDTLKWPYCVYAIDLDEDADMDVLASANYHQDSHADIVWYENDGDENFTRNVVDSYFDGALSVYPVDLDGDDDIDILGAARVDDDVTWWENDGEENFSEHRIFGFYVEARSISAADIDGDSDPDVLAVSKGSPAKITWWENELPADFVRHDIYVFGDANTYFPPTAVATDLDGDGDQDVVSVIYQNEDIAWWENDGIGGFTPHPIAFDSDTRALYTGDLDGDGDIDVLGGYNLTWWEQDSTPPVVADYPLFDGFESGALEGHWSVYSTYVGKVSLSDEAAYSGSYGLRISSRRGRMKATSAAILHIDLEGQTDVEMSFRWRERHGFELTPYEIFISADQGGRWHKIFDLVDSETWHYAIIDLDQAAADNGLTYNDHFLIKFQFTDTDKEDFYERIDLDDLLIQRAPYRIYTPMLLQDGLAPAAAPVLAEISNTDGDGEYTVAWSAVDRTVRYTLEEDTEASFSDPTVVYGGGVISTTIRGQGLGTYYYRVKASNFLGTTPWSETRSVDVTVEPPPPECPDSGEWSGTTDQGYPIDFTVTSSCRVGDLKIEYLLTCPSGLMWKTKTFDYSTSISNDRFHFDNNGDPTVDGRFTSLSHASGTWSSEVYIFGLGTCLGSGTWSADVP